jgi:hypothetical protein
MRAMGKCSPHAFRRPLEISLRLSRRFQSFVEIGANSLQASLSERLQFEQLSLFCVQMAGTV